VHPVCHRVGASGRCRASAAHRFYAGLLAPCVGHRRHRISRAALPWPAHPAASALFVRRRV